MTLYQRAKNVLEMLSGYAFGKRPIVFVCHSLGGLLVKQILRTAKDSTDIAWQNIAESCAGVLFLATPHSGSSLANLLHSFAGGFTSPHVTKLLSDTSDLEELNASFRTFCQCRSIDVTAYHEMHKTKKIALVVDAKSADPGVGASMPIPVDGDHLNICKPESRDSFVYLSIKRRIAGILPNKMTEVSDSTPHFDEDDLGTANGQDRRDLLAKMTAAGREHEYAFANDSQNKFARAFFQNGLKTSTAALHNNLLADIEQRFQSLIFHNLICGGANSSTVTSAIQTDVIDPLAKKYATSSASGKTIMNALYFLTERCHIRFDKP
ncbi:alpha/beta hydrolase [Mesorhizobium qingshengii]|uniref:Alpha/beta hydrolase n=2 Tax=Mesorhizobium qingshengii TaxID=1165689 RepID=A0ABT4R1U2_9HYPH|nr:ABC-three component system protein [Mesorhizobium qingshengii]MCZ8547815.1 alpha/beta hydrolase [Mesorhizobium qingshengii]